MLSKQEEQELTRLRTLTKSYPFDMPSICSMHSKRNDKCSTCYPDLWALIGEHAKVTANIREQATPKDEREPVIGDDGGTYVSFSEPCSTVVR